MGAYLHTLMHRNTSHFTSQRYSSTFSGREFFLRDHQIEQRAILPAVAALELARAAVQHASGEQDATLTLTQVVWIRPVAVAEEPHSLEIQLKAQQDGSPPY